MIRHDRALPACALAMAAALGLLTPAAAQTATPASALSYPASRALADVSAWLQRETPLLPSQVVDVAPSAVTAIVKAAPTGQPRGFLATVSSEALNPDIEAHDGVASWSIPVEVDCERRSVRLGVMTGYRSRDLRSEPKVLRDADTAFVSPTPTAPLGSVVRALCDRDFHRPLTGAGSRLARSQRAAKAPPAAAADSAPAPTAPARTAKASGPVDTAIRVQVGASPDPADAKRLMRRLKRKFAADLDGLSTEVATATVDGKTVYRALIGGFHLASEAKALCGRLQAAGQACFVRR